MFKGKTHRMLVVHELKGTTYAIEVKFLGLWFPLQTFNNHELAEAYWKSRVGEDVEIRYQNIYQV